MSIVTKESNPELYNSLFEDATIEDAKKIMQNMFNDITPEQFEELKKQALENVKKNNMSAKEMFEELCFYEKTNNKCYLIYTKYGEDRYTNENVETIITFKKKEQLVRIKKPHKTSAYNLNCQELQAINKQIEELGWLGEDNQYFK